MSTAITASDVLIAGYVVASPVPKYTACRTGSTVGEFHTEPPAGPHCCTPCEFLWVGLGRSGTTRVNHSTLPVFASRAATPPSDLQHSYVAVAALNSSNDEIGT